MIEHYKEYLENQRIIEAVKSINENIIKSITSRKTSKAEALLNHMLKKNMIDPKAHKHAMKVVTKNPKFRSALERQASSTLFNQES